MTQSADANSPQHEEFDNMLLVAHYYANRSAAMSNKSMELIVTKLSVAMLRHIDIIPADKAFYEAGMACKVRIAKVAFIYIVYFYSFKKLHLQYM